METQVLRTYALPSRAEGDASMSVSKTMHTMQRESCQSESTLSRDVIHPIHPV